MDVIILFIGIITLQRIPATGTIQSYAVYLPDGRSKVEMCKTVVAEEHHPYIRVRDWKPSDVENWKDSVPCTDGSSLDCRLFPLDGDEITITEITTGGSLTEDPTLKFIPRMRGKITGISTDAPTLSAAYLELKNGTLSGTRFPNSKNLMLFTKLRATIASKQLVVTGTRKVNGATVTRTLTFNGSAAFDFINLPKDMAVHGPATHAGSPDKSHFYLHYKLAKPDMKNEDCDNPVDHPVPNPPTRVGNSKARGKQKPQAGTVACSNSIWP